MDEEYQRQLEEERRYQAEMEAQAYHEHERIRQEAEDAAYWEEVYRQMLRDRMQEIVDLSVEACKLLTKIRNNELD